MGCKNGCKGCNDTLVGNTQKSIVAWIQPCGANPRNEAFSAMTDGDWPAVKVTGKSRNWRGARTPQWRRNSDGTSQICHVTEAVPGDNTITLEFADCGCGGYSADELAEQGTFDLYEMQRCCGLADMETGWSKMKVTRCLSFSGVDESASASYDTSEDGDLTRTYTGGLFVDAYTIYPISFAEVITATGLDAGSRISSMTYANSRAGCTTNCKDECSNAWYAVTNEGNVIYKTGGNYAIANSQIPAFVASIAVYIAQVGSLLIVGSPTGYYYATLDKYGVPGTWTHVTIDLNFTPDGITAVSDSSVVLYGSLPAGAGIAYKIDKDGSYTTIYTNTAASTQVYGYAECNGVALIGLGNGQVLHSINQCNSYTATNTAPAATFLNDVEIQPGGVYWAVTPTALYYSDDQGNTWNTVTLPGAAPTQLRRLTWVDAGVGYLVSAGVVYTTVDDGKTWTTVNTGDRISQAPTGAAAFIEVHAPCCNSKTASVNAVAITGITTALTGALWFGGVQSC